MSKDSLVSPEKCTNCKDWIDATPGMDTVIRIVERDTVEFDEYYFCDWQCVGEWFNHGTETGLIPYDSDKDSQYVEPDTEQSVNNE